jgi:L-iditol 2-dehydrogenase
MPDTMKAVYLHAAGDLRVHEEPLPGLTEPDHVLIQIGAVGVCGSDCHYYQRGRIGPFVVDQPLILGHECAGRVVEAGADVKGMRPGDLVAIEPGIPCRRCRRCKEGRYNICQNDVVFMGTPPWHGAFREYLTWPADFVFPLPDGVTLDDGAMIEPLAVGVHACRRGRIAPGQSAAVLGAGPVGLLAAQAAAAYGAHPVIVTDVIPFRLEVARRLGFLPLDASRQSPPQVLRDLTHGRGPDVVIETAGTTATIRQAMEAVRTGGVAVLVGLPPEEEADLPVMDILTREYDLRTVFRYANCYPPALSLVAAGRIDLAPLRTHQFPLERTEDAIKTTLQAKHQAIKVLVKPGLASGGRNP